MTQRKRGRPHKQPADWLRDNDEMLSWVENRLPPKVGNRLFRPKPEERFNWVLQELESALSAEPDPGRTFSKLKADWRSHKSSSTAPHQSISISKNAYDALTQMAKSQGMSLKDTASQMIIEGRKTAREIEAAKREARKDVKEALEKSNQKKLQASLGKSQVAEYKRQINTLESKLTAKESISTALQSHLETAERLVEEFKNLVNAQAEPPENTDTDESPAGKSARSLRRKTSIRREQLQDPASDITREPED